MSHYDENWKDKQGDASNMVKELPRMTFSERNGYTPLDIIGLVDRWNKDAGRTDNYFNARQTAFYTGMQCEEFAERLRAMGLLGTAGDLDRLGKELKDGVWDTVVYEHAQDPANRKEMLDGNADLMVVTIGAAQGEGANFKEAMARVLAANEAKRFSDGKLHKSENGKILKPAGWTAPDLTSCINDTVARS